MSRLPVNDPYTVTTPFGVPDSNAKFGKHSGIDYAVPSGRPIYAVTSGELTNVVSPTGGNMVVIFDGKWYHRLMHNSSFSRGNGHVNEGDEVAKCGTTGLSTGPHCHWDVNNEGTYPTTFNSFIDPNIWLKEGGFMYPNRGDLINVSNATGWPGHPLNDNDFAYWVDGTGNTNASGNDRATALAIEVSNWSTANAQPTSFKEYNGKQLFVKED